VSGPPVPSRRVDVLVVGAGPSGLATATELAGMGCRRVEVVEREREAGGIPRHSRHTGFGLRDLHRLLTGPQYAARRIDLAVQAGVRVRTSVSVTGWASPPTDGVLALSTTGPDGLERIEAGAVVLATGARERPRPARWVPGDRPDGVYTTGRLQQTVYDRELPVGRLAVVVGAEHVSFSAVVTLHHAGVRVAAMVTDRSRQQSYAALRLAAAARYRFPLLTGTVVTRVVGHGRVQAVQVRAPDGTVRAIACDTVVFTGDWVADNELARTGLLGVDPASTGPWVDTALRSTVPGVVCAGNLVHPVLTADLAALDAATAAASAMDALRTADGSHTALPSVGFVLGEELRWVAPGRVGPDRAPPPRGRFVLWPAQERPAPVLEVRQGGELLWRHRSARPLVPQRPFEITAGWLPAVRVPGPDLVVTVH
jgi:NADPH-dependent 2,4-dienoyl-CoA reductase/sulfur reductase-like enzyme